MEIILSTSSHEPYYAQISRQIQQLILSGQLHPGDALPTIRSLAKTLRVSVITVQHAYEEGSLPPGPRSAGSGGHAGPRPQPDRRGTGRTVATGNQNRRFPCLKTL